nr:hypothetical protein [Fervidicola ferrireducens]
MKLLRAHISKATMPPFPVIILNVLGYFRIGFHKALKFMTAIAFSL